MSEEKVTIEFSYYNNLLKKENILNELESWLEEGLEEPNWEKGDIFWNYACQLVLDKLKELKGSDK